MEETKPKYYAIIPAHVRYDNQLNADEKIIYAEITALSILRGYCFATNNNITRTKVIPRKTAILTKINFISIVVLLFLDC